MTTTTRTPTRGPLRVAAAFVLLLLATLLPTGTAFACDCPMMTDDEARDLADAVFRGEVTEVRAGDDLDLIATIDVVEAWQGPWAGEVPGTVEVSTAEETTACGVRFAPGHEYLVFATGDADQLATNWCLRTAGAASAADTLASWGDGDLVVGSPAPPGDAGPWPTTAVVVTAGIVLVLVVVVVLRSRRRTEPGAS